MKKLFLFSFVVSLLLSEVAFSQAPYVTNYFLSRRNDPVSTNKIFQDTHGYIWFATNKGLYRFDGKRYRHYTLVDSLPQLNVTAIAQDSLGRIWTGHQDGSIAYLDGKHFRRFSPQEGLSPEPVSDIVFDRVGNLWFATYNDGLYYFTRDRLFRLDEKEGMPDLFVYDLVADANGDVWAGTDGGVAICTLDDRGVAIRVIDSKAGLKDNIVKRIVRDGDRAYLGTEDAGIMELNVTSGKLNHIDASWSFGSVNDMVWKDGQLGCMMIN
jgi:ligand-binding sensor domain-containing protein